MRGSTLEIRAAIKDLTDRVHFLEGLLHGGAIPKERGIHLIRMYLDAHRAPDLRDEAAAGAWLRQTYLLDVQSLIALGRAVNDDHPWRPFLAHLDQCVLLDLPGAEEAQAFLLRLARGLMDLMGLQVLEPRDLMGNLRIREAITAISS